MSHTCRPSQRRRVVTGVASATALLVLAACGDGVSPGAAAEIDGETITTGEVDDLATLICQIDQGSGEGGRPRSAQRSLALTVLLQIEVGRRIGDLDEVSQRQVSQSLSAASDARAFVSDDLKAYFDEVVAESTRSAAAADAAAAQNLVEQGEQPDPTTVQQEALRLQEEYLADHPVEIDPRFGVYQDGEVVSGDGSVSVAVSDRARSFVPESTDDPGAAASADLPASQVCG